MNKKNRHARRLLVLTQYYEPEPNFITADVARAAASEGMHVTVLTCFPNYPRGRFYPGYKPWWPSRTRDGAITVWRIPMIPDHGRSVALRFISYFSFALGAAIVAPFLGRFDLVWVYQTPPILGFVTLWHRLVGRARIAFTYADLWPESFVPSGVAVRPVILDTVRWLRRLVNRIPHVIIGSTRGTVELIREESPSAEQVVHIPVWVESSASPAPKSDPLFPRPTIIYAGNIGYCQAFDSLIHAAAVFAQRGRDVDIVFIGDGAEEQRLRDLAESIGATNVRFLGRMPAQEAYEQLCGATAQVVSLKPGPEFRYTVPSKLFFSLAVGTPILYTLEGEAAEIAAATGIAYRFDSADTASTVAAVEEILRLSDADRASYRDKSRNYYEEHYAPGVLVQRYKELLLRDPQPDVAMKAAHSDVGREITALPEARAGVD